MYNQISYFPNLNSLRFIAALLVLFHHGEVIRNKNGFAALEEFSFFLNGGSAVKFFFVLSGFLITYLLLKEKQDSNNTNIPKFYFRRIIRIWPLYFLLVIIGTILMPSIFNILHIDYRFPYSFSESWYYFAFFVPSIVTFKFGSHLLEPLWSIGVEEWFYVLWAPLFKWIKRPLIFILATLALKIVLLIAVQTSLIHIPIIIHLIKTYAFESMAFGGLGAYLIFFTKKDIKAIYQKYAIVNYLLIGLTLTFIFFNASFDRIMPFHLFHSWFFNTIVLDILFLNIIIYAGLILPKTSWLSNKWLDEAGQISYGVYMYHMLVIFTIIHFFQKQLLKLPSLISFILFYTLVIVGTLLVSYLSKRYFENYFLSFRNRPSIFSRENGAKKS